MKKSIFLFMTSGLIAACFTLPASRSKNKLTIQNMFTAINYHDWVKVASFYGDEVLMIDPGTGMTPLRMTRQEIIRHYQELNDFLPDLNDSITNILAKDDQVMVEFTAKGKTITGEYLELPICTVFTLQNGRIKKDATYYDMLNNQ